MVPSLRSLSESSQFQNFITAVILFAGVLVGIETYPHLVERYGGLLHVLDSIVLWIFVGEIVVKMGAEGSKPWRYFRDGWNCFDFIIVAACFLPFEGQAITVLRLLRLLRVLKLVRALPKLQILVGALLKSIPSMGYVSMLLLLLFYIYAVAAIFLFGANDPRNFGDLQTAMLTLFRTVTLESWSETMYINMFGCDRYGYSSNGLVPCTQPHASPVVAAVFFVSFVLIGTMIILNLFIGVIMGGMDEAQKEAARTLEKERRAQGKLPSVTDELGDIEQQLEELQVALQNVQRRLTDHRKSSLSPRVPEQ